MLDTLESLGFHPTGDYLQLNSFENRVFEFTLESGTWMLPKIIAKVYRPGRWSQRQIIEEHQWTQELFDHGIQTAPPLALMTGSTLAETQGLLFALFPRASGRMLQDLNSELLSRIGRLLAQMHNVGQQSEPKWRVALTVERFGYENVDLLERWVAPEVRNRYLDAAEAICHALEAQLQGVDSIRIHGDFHRGNLLLKDVQGEPQDLTVVDFDDFVSGPEIQDVWMLLSGDAETQAEELLAIQTGYEELRSFPHHQIQMIPLLRGLRIISYGAWIARRWEDPVFPQLFPQFRDYDYWAEEAEILEKIAASHSDPN